MQYQKNIFKTILISCIFIIISIFNLNLVKAQEQAAKTDLIWQKERSEAEISQARLVYRQSLEEYRSQERLYTVAYDQYVNLRTLATLEDLVIKTKAISLIRDQTLINYLELLKLNLYGSEGIELSVKNKYLDLLTEKIKFLKKHQEDLQGKSSQSEVQLSLDDFNQLSDLNKISQQILALLTLSRFQRIYDLALPLKKDIDKFLNVAETSALSAAVRASEETNKTLNRAETNLNLLREKSKNPNSLESLYNNLTTELNPVYINLSQSLAYLEELLNF